MASQAVARMRRYRERKKEAATASGPILFERADWRLFTDPRTLPQKAGCEPRQIGRAILKELVDNALDSGGTVSLEGDATGCIVTDTGPGINPAEVSRLFAIARPLVSSKLQRLPTRGMLGNGLRVVMGAIAAFSGTISVTTRGQRYELGPDSVTGTTRVLAADLAHPVPGLTVELHFPQPLFDDDDFAFARKAVRLAGYGVVYDGPSLPSWYSERGLRELLAAAPSELTASEVVTRVFGIPDSVPEPSAEWAEAFIASSPVLSGEAIGQLGEDACVGYYRRVTGTTTIDGAKIPFCVEAWVVAAAMGKGENTYTVCNPLINRSPALAQLEADADSTGLRVHGCGLDIKLSSSKRANYYIDLSLIAPFLRLTGDGKAPFLGDFRDAIEKALKGAAGEAYRCLVRPKTAMSIIDAARKVMEEAYLKVSENSDGPRLPAKARQIMYAARGRILELTGRKKFDEHRFTQELLPEYMRDNPEETKNWDVIYDARGHLVEPHTLRAVPLGTLQVREYLGQRQPRGSRAIALADGVLYPTTGPRHRYRNILFVEKEGFDELFEAVQLAERYDLAIMSTKGMSVVAARKLLDENAPFLDHIFVLHDFDISGFSIFGTLFRNSRRYTFTNDVEDKIVDIGLRLENVEDLGLETETVDVKSREARRETLYEHGATDDEVEFLAPYDETEECRRVELNAMTSRQLVDFVEAALQDNSVEKVIPDAAVLEQQARHRLQIKLTKERLAAFADDVAQEAAAAALPKWLAARVRALLGKQPQLSWDQALAQIIG